MPTTTDTQILDQLAAHAGSLYTLPTVALEILQLTSSSKIDVRALKERIECDPALTTKILRTVNSAIFGLSGQVSDLNQAIALLGIKSLKMLVLGFSLPKRIFEGVDKEVLSQYWRQTLTRAVACRELCRVMRSRLGDETFIAALLKDLGILVLIQELGEPYVQLLLRSYRDRYDLSTLEYRAIGFDHTQLAGRLLRGWSLPETLVHTIDAGPQHPMPLSPEVVQQRAILAVAEKVSLLLASGRSGELRDILRLAKDTLHLDEASFYEAIGQIEELVLQLGDILSLQLPEGLGYEDLLDEARKRMKEVSSSLDVKVTKKDISPEEYASLEVELQNVARMLTRTMDAKKGTASQEERPASSSERPKACVATEPSLPKSSQKATTAPGLKAVHPSEAPIGRDAGPHHPHTPPVAGVASGRELLLDRVSKAIVLCRDKRIPLSLLVSDVILWGGKSSSSGRDIFRPISPSDKLLGNARHDLDQVSGSLDHPFLISSPYGENGIAMVLLDCERNKAIELADDLVRSMPKEYDSLSSHKAEEGEPGVRLGVGIASASSISPNFSAEGLVEGAERCLHVALTTIGRPVKSIEVF